MSVRARRVKKIEYEKETTFNLHHDDELVDLLGQELYGQLDEDGCGLISFSLEFLYNTYQKAESRGTSQERTMKILDKMIRQAKEEGWVEYFCF